MKRMLAGFLAVILLVLALPLAALGSETQISEGTYEGEYDSSGKRSGQGRWTCQNFVYEGQWENDMPNGQGTLYESWVFDDGTGNAVDVVQGHWVDGFADGPIWMASYYWDGDRVSSNVYYGNVAEGFVPEDTSFYGVWRREDGTIKEAVESPVSKGQLLGGVPPWARVELDPSASPPALESLDVAAWDTDAFLAAIAEAKAEAEALARYDGTYEGEYDAAGKRSGQGTWTYHNFRYVGQWDNDMPNGQGTLYESWVFDDGTGNAVDVVQGHWVDGFADGPIWTASYYWNGDRVSSNVYYGNVAKGFVPEDTSFYGVWRREDGTIKEAVESPVYKEQLWGGVPPWARVELDSSASLSALESLDVAAWDTDAFLAVIAEAKAEAEALARYEGTYEGEYDASGKRSGQGTWTYHNFRYVGQWDNDMPNGKGTLYEGYQYPDFPNRATVIQGQWVDGCAEGPILLSDHSADGEETVFYTEVEQGRSPRSTAAQGMSRIDQTAALMIAREVGGTGKEIVATIEERITNANAEAKAMAEEGVAEEEIQAKVADAAARIDVEAEGLLLDFFSSGSEAEKKAVIETTAALLADYNVEEFFEIGRLHDKGVLVAGVPPWADELDAIPENDPPEPRDIALPPWAYAHLIAAVAPDSAAADAVGTDEEGDYEGERDANGLRSGQGTWAYNNLLYVGQWQNDMPNGQGTLYVRRVYRDSETTEITWQRDVMVRGHWRDGALNGAAEATYFNEDTPLVVQYGNVHEGMLSAQWPYTLAANARVVSFGWHMPMGQLPPWYALYLSEMDAEVGAPWDLYQRYPNGKVDFAPLTKMESTGVSVTPGNLANGGGMAALGDWIFMSARKDDLTTVYKMRTDGSQRMKIFEHNNDYATRTEYWGPEFQVIGDWLYAGYPYKMRADDPQFTRDEAYFLRTSDNGGDIEVGQGLVVDGWVYQLVGYPADVLKISLDYTSLTVLGGREHPEELFDRGQIIAADADWVYVYRQGNDWNSGYNEIVRAKTDGSGKAQVYSIWNGSFGKHIVSPQVVGGRIYYAEEQIENEKSVGYHVVSVDPDLAENPVPVVSCPAGYVINALHVTDDCLYYAGNDPGEKTWEIVRVNHDGSSPTVLVDGLYTVASISIAGNWMMFEQYEEKTSSHFLMRLDGSGLHRLGEPYVPEGAPGMTDSTGKWRYELLTDGSTMILGPGSKLKQTGKLAIPKAVDQIPVTAIGANAFYGCDSFTGVTIPKGVTTIGDYAFFFCKGLTGVTIPEGVTHIGEGAFGWCVKAKKVSLPASLTSVGPQAFADCPSVKLSVAKKNEVFEVVDGVLFDMVRNRVVD